jgi:outer membrane lipoprotein carrier protein
MIRLLFTILVCLLTPSVILAAPETTPAADPALEAKLADIDARAAKIEDFSGRFEQQKFTALLRKPLISNGTIRKVGPLIRWDTEKPEPSVLFSDGKEFRLYYPKQKLLEVYSLGQRMADLVASPIPRLQTLKGQFSIEPLDAATAKRDAPDLAGQPDVVPVRLRPTEAFLKEHVREVRVLLDAKSARMLCVTTVDADGDRTVMRFTDVKINTGLKPADVQLNVPGDVKVSRPMGDKGQ